jgi:hypothetical protein
MADTGKPQQHTPGPWRVSHYARKVGEEPYTAPVVVDASGTLVADVYRNARERDAALIAAAPELLAALVACRELLDNFDVRYYIGNKLGEQTELYRALNAARAAIAKATEGGTP